MCDSIGRRYFCFFFVFWGLWAYWCVCPSASACVYSRSLALSHLPRFSNVFRKCATFPVCQSVAQSETWPCMFRFSQKDNTAGLPEFGAPIYERVGSHTVLKMLYINISSGYAMHKIVRFLEDVLRMSRQQRIYFKKGVCARTLRK